MAKHCETYDHPSDLGLTARGDSLAEVFEALAEGLANEICPREQVHPRHTRQICARANQVEYLAVEFLSELMSLFDLERFLPAEVHVIDINENAVRADVLGETYNSRRHELGPEIKAVTYHELEVRQDDAGWVARVLCDL